MSETLGLAVVAKNEARTIQACLRSVPFSVKTVVVDSGSTDRTCELAREAGARVIERAWPGYPKQKQFAMDQLDTDWVLCLDADEFLTEEAQSEIQGILSSAAPASIVAFRIPRYHVFLGRVVRHGRGVDFPLRLIRKGGGRYSPREIHEEIVTDGNVGVLRFGMIHESSPTFRIRLAKMRRDLEMESPYFDYDRHHVTLRTLFVEPLRHFLSFTLKRGGWKDGVPGILLIAVFSLQMVLLEVRFLQASMRRRST
jgi:glycosyltransferase involved in cell wall biosynthesis